MLPKLNLTRPLRHRALGRREGAAERHERPRDQERPDHAAAAEAEEEVEVQLNITDNPSTSSTFVGFTR